MPPNERMRYYPAVGPAIPRRRTSCSRVTHPSATEPELPPVPYDLHVLGTPPAFVLSQNQTLQRLKNSNSSNRTTVFPRVVRITSELKPHGATRLTACALVSGPHSTRSTINSQRAHAPKSSCAESNANRAGRVGSRGSPI